MKLFLFFKLFFLSVALSLAAFALNSSAGFMFLSKSLALGTGASIVVSLFYSELRGVRQGDIVAVAISNSLISRIGRALNNARKNSEVRVRFDNGNEAIGVLESYSGLISPPKVRVMYEEKIVE